jgi:VWFA-related protein
MRARGGRLRLLAGSVVLLAAAGSIPGRAADPDPVPVPLIETSRSELVLIEVYARDRKGNPVRDLKISDFTLRIDHDQLPKPINSLEWIEAPMTPPPAGALVAGGEAPSGPAGLPGAATAPAVANQGEVTHHDRPRRFLLFFEDSTSAPTQMTAARRAAIQFLDRPGLPSDQFGIAAYSEKRKLEILQEFTSDRALLHRVLEKSAADTARWTDYSGERITRREEIERQRGLENQTVAPSGDAAHHAGATTQADMMARTYATEDSSRMSRVLNNTRILIDALAPWPGYKALVFIGEGVPENPGEDFGLNDPRLAISSELSSLAFAAGGANVTLHSIQVSGVPAGDSKQVAAALRRSSALTTLALDTGGVSVASNDLSGAFTNVEESSAGYYLLTYVPVDPPDGNYHSVALKLKRGDVTIRYRRGFVRYKPDEARTRAIQAAYVAPDLHREMGLDLAVVPGPSTGHDRVWDLVLYVPPRRLLFLPQAGGPAVRLEVGIVAYDGGGSETFRLARRVRIAPEAQNLAEAARSGFDLFTRVRLPDRSQTITAVISDLQSGDLGSVRVTAAPPAAGSVGGAQGLSLYAPHEKSLWIEIAEAAAKPADDNAAAGKPAAGAEVDAGVTVGPALRTRFAPGERIACGFRPGAGSADPGAEMRLVVRLGEEVVRSLPFSAAPAGATAAGTLHADLATSGLADGDYIASVETTRAGATTEIGRMPFRIRPRGTL